MTSKVIAITGGIGSGKSEVKRYLDSLGYSTIDCDVLARNVATQPNVLQQVRQLLGNEYVVNGQLDRKAIRNRVFEDEQLLKQYNDIFFGEVKQLLRESIAQYNSSQFKYDSVNKMSCNVIFVEISVFDAFNFAWDEVWLVESDLEVRKDRVVERDRVTRQNVDSIISRQYISSRYTLKIENNGSLDDLRRSVNEALKNI